VNQVGGILTTAIAEVTNPPQAVVAGQDGAVFLIVLQVMQ